MLVICRTRGTCGRLTAGEGVVLQRGIVHSVWEHGEHGRCTKVNMIQRTPCFCRRSLKSTYTSLVAQDGKADGREPASCPAMWSSPRVGQEATQRLQTPAVGHRVCRPAYTRAKKAKDVDHAPLAARGVCRKCVRGEEVTEDDQLPSRDAARTRVKRASQG